MQWVGEIELIGIEGGVKNKIPLLRRTMMLHILIYYLANCSVADRNSWVLVRGIGSNIMV